MDRELSFAEAGIDSDADIQQAPLFPVLKSGDISADVVRWLVTTAPSQRSSAEGHRGLWLGAERLNARQLSQQCELSRLYAKRAEHRLAAMPTMAAHGVQSVFYKLDLMDTARSYAHGGHDLPTPFDAQDDVLVAMHDRMFRSQVLKLRGDDGWRTEEEAAFRLLEQAIVSRFQRQPRVPACQLADDQIVWARSPARVDLAGGWTDTPPYCLEHGGAVTNIALNLNGQPPIQAFARRCEERTITIRSIDLGISEQLSSYKDVANYRGVGSGFAVAKAALALCGFHPDFHHADFGALSDQLDMFGGGVELSMLAAIPKGSGLGTSSILAGTVLAALAELCGFSWDTHQIAGRVSVVEQMLGSGGGWQDQLGGLLRGAKLLTTSAGLEQSATVRWLPSDFFESPELISRGLLYYTGITRVAHEVLGEIVRGMFLNEPSRLNVLRQIGANGHVCFDTIQKCDLDGFARSIATSWELNQELDKGTNPPEVEELVTRISPYASGLKLAGAGGGGFLYILAKDEERAVALRRELKNAPPNDRARFVDMSISKSGLAVTRS